jgi:hypothetical protein
LERTNACSETNDTSEKSPGIQILNDTLKMIVSLKKTSREVIEARSQKPAAPP